MKYERSGDAVHEKKKIRYLLLGMCLIGIVISGLIVRQIKRAGAEELTETYLWDMRGEKTSIIKNYLEEQGIEVEVLWSSLIVQNKNVYLLYEYKPKNEEYARELCLGLEGTPEDYDYLGYLKLKRTFKKGVLKYYKVVESKETLCSEEIALSEGLYGCSGYDGATQIRKHDWYGENEFIWFMKVYTDEIEEIEFYDDDSLLKATYHVGDKGYIFIVLQDVRNVMARFYDKEHNLIGERDYADYHISDPLQDYINIEKGRVYEWES